MKSELTIYQTRMIDADLSADGRTAVLTFMPHGHAPVTVHLPREALEVFLEKAAAVIKPSIPPRTDA